MPFTHQRTVRFQETDAAGVVYFANILAICHEAYEASLIAAEIDLKSFFQGAEVAVPIVHANVDFRRPLCCGDALSIQLAPQAISDSEFEISYQISLASSSRLTNQAHTRHVCIDAVGRSRRELPLPLRRWLQLFSQD